jgi:hypothetical protein
MGNIRHIQYGDFFWSYGRAPGKVPIYYGPHIASRAIIQVYISVVLVSFWCRFGVVLVSFLAQKWLKTTVSFKPSPTTHLLRKAEREINFKITKKGGEEKIRQGNV